jgi:DMSO/TMAO reductase YedYZ heme-binding membrane subunit
MFLTSNDLSKKAMGKLWKKLHRFVYLVLWLLVLHTALQRISIWTFLIAFVAILEIASWVYHLSKKSSPSSPNS